MKIIAFTENDMQLLQRYEFGNCFSAECPIQYAGGDLKTDKKCV